MGDVEIEEIKRVVNGLDLLDLDEPDFDVLGGGEQDTMSMLLSLAEDVVQILDTRHHAYGDLPTLGRRLRTRVQSCPET